MDTSNNTILITGGGSGIGRGLAEALHHEGNKVIIAARRKGLLDEVTKSNPGMKSVVLDIEDAVSIQATAQQLAQEFPRLNVVIHNAGIMRPENLQQPNLADAEATINTNLLGPIRLTAAMLPSLLKQPKATIMTVSSGLAFLPLAMTPTYSATKAAIHSWTQTLRWQLRHTKVQVIELAPPYVQTELMGPGQATDSRAMPLPEFLNEVMHLIKTQPHAEEILVERVKPLRFAEKSGKYEEAFKALNEARPSPH